VELSGGVCLGVVVGEQDVVTLREPTWSAGNGRR